VVLRNIQGYLVYPPLAERPFLRSNSAIAARSHSLLKVGCFPDPFLAWFAFSNWRVYDDELFLRPVLLHPF